MKTSAARSYQWIFYLAASFYFAAVFLRSILIYQGDPVLARVLALLMVFLALVVSEPVIYQRWHGYFPVYLTGQTILVFVLLAQPGFPDFFAVLLAILSMQIMLRLPWAAGAVWMSLCTLGLLLVFQRPYGAQAYALALIYTAGNVFLGAYALAIRRSQAARDHNQELVSQLQAANRQLQDYSAQNERLVVERERNRMARELHDSVTQTVFSMTLVVKSAILLLERDPGRVAEQLEHMAQLTRKALAEIQVLISELHQAKSAPGGFETALRAHLAERSSLDQLLVTLNMEGTGSLTPEEGQGLFRIIQEALNNVAKHARVSEAQICVHLEAPFSVEVVDQGRGFDLQQVLQGRGIGLPGMCERAEEIGWNLEVIAAPGAGTRIRVEKSLSDGR